ncbi:carbohydrate kinase family protein [Gilliamella sp. A7]|uniref:carbohydrate kinase family protein n=1 Tax=Gilliamella sp. A7 TaxID=1970465 RepID=UPI0013029D6E|nr:carbohydrate kinase family protein [Gilliamella sp. A7]
MTILTVGFACLDLLCFTSPSLEQNGSITSDNFVRCGGGSCANTAYLLALWGEDIYHIGHLNNDNYGNQIETELANIGVNTRQFIFSEKMITPLEAITVDEKNNSYTIISHRLIQPPKLTTAEKNKLAHFIRTISENKHEIVMLADGYEAELGEYLIEHLPKVKVIMSVDNLSANSLYLAQHADYLIVTEQFASAFVKLKTFHDSDKIKNALKKLRNLTNGKIIIRMNNKDCVYLDRQQVVIIPGFNKQTADNITENDIFQGAFTYGISYGWPLAKTILFANLAIAAVKKQKRGRKAMPNLVDINQAGKDLIKDFKYFF